MRFILNLLVLGKLMLERMQLVHILILPKKMSLEYTVLMRKQNQYVWLTLFRCVPNEEFGSFKYNRELRYKYKKSILYKYIQIA